MLTAQRPSSASGTDDRRRPAWIFKPGGRWVDPAAVSRALRDRAGAQHGFTLIEVLVSAMLVLIISAGVATALISATDFTSHERNQSQANGVAEQDQERLKSMTDAQLTALSQTRIVNLNGGQFTVHSTAEFLSANGSSSCSSDSTAYFKLTSTVTTVPTAGNPAQTVTEEALITRPLAGSLVVPVQNETGAPLQGVAIAINGQNTSYTASATTDQNGCVAFAGLPTDTYTITATDPGYVDPNGNASPTETASVTQTGITPATKMIMGAAASVKVGFVTQTASTPTIFDQHAAPFASGHAAAPDGAEISYYGTGSGNHMTTDACFIGTACTGTGTPVTYTAAGNLVYLSPGHLFPFYLGSSPQYTNNYQMWAGACEQEEPLSPPTLSAALAPPSLTSVKTDFATVGPGNVASAIGSSNVDALVFEPAILVAVKYGGGAASLPSHVDIDFTGKNSAGAVSCQDNWTQVPSVGTETVGGIAYGIYPAPFASTAATGTATASATGDTGTISVCADYGSPVRHVWSPALTDANTTWSETTVKGSSGNSWLDVKTDTGNATGSCP
jgi:prepilin-type N-terminal cleavage/methylation domain-containing protein